MEFAYWLKLCHIMLRDEVKLEGQQRTLRLKSSSCNLAIIMTTLLQAIPIQDKKFKLHDFLFSFQVLQCLVIARHVWHIL